LAARIVCDAKSQQWLKGSGADHATDVSGVTSIPETSEQVSVLRLRARKGREQLQKPSTSAAAILAGPGSYSARDGVQHQDDTPV
jgi:hypothetical protein